MGRTERNGHDGSLRLAGRYRLIEKLGTGGMSVVWRGYDEILGREVAVKVLSPRLAEDRTFRDRLRQEALAAARLCHPHITGIHDFGEAPISERLTVPYVVMELNDGESVSARIGRQGALDWREAVLITTEVASALATAHARGLVHRDVTPANVMLTGAGAKIVDFGISAVVGQCDAAADGSLLGTPAYLAPERLGGAAVSPATDVYALGLLLYRALTGRMPWPAGNTTEALRAHLYADPAPLPELGGMPPGVAELCLRCLAKSPADRPAAAEVARALAATVGVRPIIPPLRPDERRAAPAARAVVPVPAPWGASGGARHGGARQSGVRHGGVRQIVRTCLGRPASAVAGVRLRAGLRIGSALHLGSVRHLGGGLFVGNRRRHGMLSAKRLEGGPDRKPAIAALTTVALLAAAVLSWSADHAAKDVDHTRTTAAGPGVTTVVGAERIRCTVRYQVRRDSGGHFEARLNVATSETSDWRVEFTYPGTQRLAAPPRSVAQHGRRVAVTGRGRAGTVILHGGYRDRNPLPLAFALNGEPCRAEVTGGVTRGPAADNSVKAATVEGPPAEPEKAQQRRRPPSRRSGNPRGKPAPAPTATTGDVGPAPKRSAGFSLAL